MIITLLCNIIRWINRNYIQNGVEMSQKEYRDGVYIGEMKNGKRNGFGTFTFNSIPGNAEVVFSGLWKDDILVCFTNGGKVSQTDAQLIANIST